MNRITAAAIVALLVSTGAAGAQETAQWSKVGGWSIRIDRTIGNGCYAYQTYEEGTSIRVGFDLSKQSIYMILGNPVWRSLEVGKVYTMQFVFDDQKKYSGELTGIELADRIFLNHSDVSLDFTKDFMQRNTLRITFRGSQIAHLSLRNTYAAMAEVVTCQEEMDAAEESQKLKSGDPFAGTSKARTADPFR